MRQDVSNSNRRKVCSTWVLKYLFNKIYYYQNGVKRFFIFIDFSFDGFRMVKNVTNYYC